MDAAPDRADMELPADALVLCAMVPPLMVDPQSFGLWMKMLAALPDAVLWLPSYAPRQYAGNLQGAAAQAGIDGERLVFQQDASRARTLARLPLADLFVDTVRFNANQGLVDALRMGVPAVTCAGQNMASRLGGSIVQARWSARRRDAVPTSAFVDTVVRPRARRVGAGRAAQPPGVARRARRPCSTRRRGCANGRAPGRPWCSATRMENHRRHSTFPRTRRHRLRLAPLCAATENAGPLWGLAQPAGGAFSPGPGR